METNIYIFGDSIAFGNYDPAGGWAQRLNKFFMEKYVAGEIEETLTYNLSITGDQSRDIASRMDGEIKPRLHQGTENIIIYAVGLNDSVFVHSISGNCVAFDEFKENLQKLAGRAKEFAKTVVFVGVTPVCQEIVDPLPWNADKSYRNVEAARYDAALMVAAKDSGARYIPLFDKFIAADHKILLHDGLHPNSAGHQLIFETVRNFLQSNKII